MKRHFHTALYLLDVSVEQNAHFFLSGIVIDRTIFLMIKVTLIQHIGKCGKLWGKIDSYFRGKWKTVSCEQFCVFISRFYKKAVTDLWGRSLKILIIGVSQFLILSEFYIILFIHLFLATKYTLKMQYWSLTTRFLEALFLGLYRSHIVNTLFSVTMRWLSICRSDGLLGGQTS